VCRDERKAMRASLARRATRRFNEKWGWRRSNFLVSHPDEIEDYAKLTGNPGYVGLINTAHPAPNQAADLALPESGDSSTRSVLGRAYD
jgi:hypothetical protein